MICLVLKLVLYELRQLKYETKHSRAGTEAAFNGVKSNSLDFSDQTFWYDPSLPHTQPRHTEGGVFVPLSV